MADKFMDLTARELLAVAKEFGTEVHHKSNKTTIINKLNEDGVTFEMYKEMLTEEEEEAPEALDEDGEEAPVNTVDEDEGEPQLIKMTRKNASYEIRGYKFTQQHPYALVKEEDADYLIETGGWRPASSKEFKAFYAQ